MNDSNYFVVWKGVKTGPFGKEQLEREFLEGRMGLVRTVLYAGRTMSAGEFVTDLDIVRREDQLATQLRFQEQKAEAAKEELERQREVHQKQLEEAVTKLRGKTIPPPIPDVNPWAPGDNAWGRNPKRNPSTKLKWSYESTTILLGYLLCAVTLFSGQTFREVAGLLSLAIGIALAARNRITAGIVLIVIAFGCYGLGILLTGLIHEYIINNLPH